jgi:hypothetical protein
MLFKAQRQMHIMSNVDDDPETLFPTNNQMQ